MSSSCSAVRLFKRINLACVSELFILLDIITSFSVASTSCMGADALTDVPPHVRNIRSPPPIVAGSELTPHVLTEQKR